MVSLLHLELIFITFTVAITFSVVITFSGDTGHGCAFLWTFQTRTSSIRTMSVDKYIAWAHINDKKIKFKGSTQCTGSMEKQTKSKRFR